MQIPALNELAWAAMRVLLNGDKSQWERALQMPHYNSRSMPAVSLHTGMHLIQWIRSGHFRVRRTRGLQREEGVGGQGQGGGGVAGGGAARLCIVVWSCRMLQGKRLAPCTVPCLGWQVLAQALPVEVCMRFRTALSQALCHQQGIQQGISRAGRCSFPQELLCSCQLCFALARACACTQPNLLFTPASQMYDYGSAAANFDQYGCAAPPDIAADYHRLDVPVDIIAGRHDGVVARENVVQHYLKLQAAGCRVSFKEFQLGHLDFVFSVKDELRHYLLSRLLQPL